MEKLTDIIEGHNLALHPFEGWFREVRHVAGQERRLLMLIDAENHIPWHRLQGEAVWTHAEGAPAVLSTSGDGETAQAHQLGPDRRAIVAPKHFQTLETLGHWTLFELTLCPDLSISDRELCPEDWFPQRRIDDTSNF
ncbi:MAG: cupin domain-containing protein [Pseudomonadota bacterium]